MGNRIMCMEVRMPFAKWNGFAIVCMVMMPVGVFMVMDMLHDDMRMPMFMRKQIGNNNCKSQKRNRNEVNPLKGFMNKQIR